MAIRTVLKMGDPLLLQVAQPVTKFDTPELQVLLEDMHDTMIAMSGAGLAAPQIGVSKQVVVFGFKQNARYPEADEVPYTVLINPEITPLGNEEEEGWEGCLSVPGLRGMVPRYKRIRYTGF
ncbi:MAG TPA: peptide deformylase, partial [Burkholderiales bacterium]|nr:peptide deformylase [Burkholderiales bacterium]